MALKEKLFTTPEAARLLQLTPGRIRQICREFDIGTVHGNTRVLTAEDLKRLESRPDRRKREQPVVSD